MKSVKYFTSACLFLFLTFQGMAQETPSPEELITDRPDETEAPALVPKGFLQVETGFFYKEFSRDISEDLIRGYNTSLLRYGLLENLELRIGTDLIKREEKGNEAENNTGLTPLLLGAKIGIAEEKGVFPEIGIMGHIYLPFLAVTEYRPETVGVDFRFAFSHNFLNSDLTYNVGAQWQEDSPEATFIYTISYAYDITGNFGAFAELYGDLPEDDSAEHFWDAGITYDLSQNVQLDAFIGSGFNNSQRIYLGGGISFRIPE